MATMWVHRFPDATNTLVWPYEDAELITVQSPVQNGTAYSGTRAKKVRIYTDTDCHYEIGPAAVATTNSPPLDAGEDRVETLLPGQRVSVLIRT